MSAITDGPHYEVCSTELAAWLERNGMDSWWNVDGDPLLTGRLTFPCPADELIPELRRIGKPLLVQAKKHDAGAKGQVIDATKLDGVVERLKENVTVTGAMPEWGEDRFFYFTWKGSPHEWMLAEDILSAQQAKEAAKAN